MAARVTGLNFGNVCIGAGGGHTLGFWSNKNGQALFGTDDLAAMVGGLNLRNANGSALQSDNVRAVQDLDSEERDRDEHGLHALGAARGDEAQRAE